MSLTSFSFIIFFCVLILLMGILQGLRRWSPYLIRAQIGILLFFSYYFIYKNDWRFCICIIGLTAFTYIIGIQIEKERKKTWIAFGVSILILFLAYFKYTSFFLNSIRKVIGLDDITLKIILPLGISFYVFSAISYLVDVYRGDYEPEKNIIDFALFISFFPKLTAGPIVRGIDFFPQIKDYKGITRDRLLIGIQIFAFGLFKKIVLADHLSVFVDDVFHAPTAFNTGTVILAAVSYSLQIYFDFSGYSDIAIGISKILGFDFKPNFNLPYISQNVSEFWERWHISLSSWFKDYLYIPLGGNRKGEMRTYLNLLIVMLISGLWHGAGWTFIAWGALHGILSCLNKAIGKKMGKTSAYIKAIITFAFVTLLWVIFRADNFSTAISVWQSMFLPHDGINQPYTWSFFSIICLTVSTIVAIICQRRQCQGAKQHHSLAGGFYPIMNLSSFWGLMLFFTFCGLTIILGYFGNTVFIYGRF